MILRSMRLGVCTSRGSTHLRAQLSRYYGWSFEQGVFRYFEHPVHLSPEKALEGKYVIQTEEFDLNAVQAVEAYKDLSEVERSFRQLKDLVEMRPIYHHRPNRRKSRNLSDRASVSLQG